jgi:hypothetical protein
VPDRNVLHDGVLLQRKPGKRLRAQQCLRRQSSPRWRRGFRRACRRRGLGGRQPSAVVRAHVEQLCGLRSAVDRVDVHLLQLVVLFVSAQWLLRRLVLRHRDERVPCTARRLQLVGGYDLPRRFGSTAATARG